MVSILKLHIKSLIATILYLSGFLHLIAIFRLKNKAIVLMYHRVLSKEDFTDSPTTSGIIVTKNTFQKHVQFLVKHFNIVDYKNFNNSLKNNIPFKSKTCLITFDDGWSDNFSDAMPILTAHNCPALIFLPTDYVGTGKQFWQERLTALLQTALKNKPATNNLLNDIKSKYNPDKVETKSAHDVRQLVSSLKGQPEIKIRALISNIETELEGLRIPPPNNANDGFIDWEQAKLMAQSVFTIGSHAVSHRLLDRLDTKDLRFELNNSKEILESKLSTSVTTIAYPNGNHSETTKSATKKAGYQTGFSTNPGYVTNNSDLYSINRINMHEMATYSIPLLYTRILGIF